MIPLIILALLGLLAVIALFIVPAIIVYLLMGAFISFVTGILSNPFFWLTLISVALIMVFLQKDKFTKKTRRTKKR